MFTRLHYCLTQMRRAILHWFHCGKRKIGAMVGGSYYDIVIPIVSGRSVLDVGSIGHSYHGRKGYKNWNFAVLQQHAARVKGLDMLVDEVALARADGFDIIAGNAETYLAPEPYEVVFAGDVIEHLSNPGLFLSCAHKNLRNGGRVVISTPNTYSLAKLVRVVLRRTNEPPVNPEHTFYFTPQTLQQLLIRHGFSVDQVAYCDFEYTATHGSRFKRAQLAMNSWISGWLPQFSQTMVVVCSKVSL
jgi:SAM-dependent methyltransferase